MALSAGGFLGPYEILAPLGEGGMGEVYRARDTKLKRDIAIKVLPELVAAELRDRRAVLYSRGHAEPSRLSSTMSPGTAGVS